jgi:hypothetical protein
MCSRTPRSSSIWRGGLLKSIAWIVAYFHDITQSGQEPESCHRFPWKAATPEWGMGVARDADITLGVCCPFLTCMREEQRPAQRVSRRPIREVLRLQWASGLRDRKIAQRLQMSRPTVAEYVRRAQAAGLSWPFPTSRDALALERRLFSPTLPPPASRGPPPDWPQGHRELRRKGVTLFLLWQE